jgi:hypothetical protein
MSRIIAVAVLFAATAAHAGEGTRLDVEAGKTVEVVVGYATGWFCDDPSLVRAQLVTRNDRNVWIVTGVKLGSTECRVGTDPARAHYLFDLHVVKAKPHQAGR